MTTMAGSVMVMIMNIATMINNDSNDSGYLTLTC